MVPMVRIELTTQGFSVLCSTTELHRRTINSQNINIKQVMSKDEQSTSRKCLLCSILLKENLKCCTLSLLTLNFPMVAVGGIRDPDTA